MNQKDFFLEKIDKKIIITEVDQYLDDVYRKLHTEYQTIDINGLKIENNIVQIFQNNNNLKENSDIYNIDKEKVGKIKEKNGDQLLLEISVNNIKENKIMIENTHFLYFIKKNNEYFKVIPENNENKKFIYFCSNSEDNNSKSNTNQNYITGENIITFLITLSIGFIIGNNISSKL